ncbi:MAG: hypothetical protein HYV04_13480 [Deltaproteobacteria bacterium]|nr:hypothetical protein [Deltaproteobacteria bacterium]
MFLDRTWFVPGTESVKTPLGLRHIESELCWCDPVIEVDQSGRETVLHMEVTWN